MLNLSRFFSKPRAMTRLDLMKICLQDEMNRWQTMARAPNAAAVLFKAELDDGTELLKNWPKEQALRCSSCASNLKLVHESMPTLLRFDCTSCRKHYLWANYGTTWHLVEMTKRDQPGEAAEEAPRPNVKQWMQGTAFRGEDEIAALIRFRASHGDTPKKVAQELIANGLPVIQVTEIMRLVTRPPSHVSWRMS